MSDRRFHSRQKFPAPARQKDDWIRNENHGQRSKPIIEIETKADNCTTGLHPTLALTVYK
jgi:hypothetical protein